MRGKNTIHLNQATIIDAVQMYLNSRFKEGHAPVVECVDYDKSNGYNGDTFIVKTTEAGEEKKDD